MRFFKKKRQVPKRRELTEQELEEARKKWEEFHKNLPKEFIISSRCKCLDANGERISLDLHFVLDSKSKIPGLYRTKFDLGV